MAHAAPTPGTEARRDAWTRAARTLGQAAAVTILIGAAGAITDLAGTGQTVTLETLAIAALTGAGTALASWTHRRLEAWQETRRDGSSSGA